jgi:hypothetical protein
MAIVRTALGTGQAKAATLAVTWSGGAITGDTIVVLVASDAGISSLVVGRTSIGTDQTFGAADVTATNAGNVITSIYSIVLNRNYPLDGLNNPYCIATPTVSGDAVAVAVIKLEGLSAAAFDRSSAGTGTGTSPSSGATAALSQADEICVGAIGTEGPPTDAAGTWSNSFNAGQRDGTDSAGAASNVTISEGYLVVSGTTAQTAAKTSIASRDWAAAIATYKGAAAAAFIAAKNRIPGQAVKRSNFY